MISIVVFVPCVVEFVLKMVYIIVLSLGFSSSVQWRDGKIKDGIGFWNVYKKECICVLKEDERQEEEETEELVRF